MIRKTVVIFLIGFNIFSRTSAQHTATTDDGRRVQLNTNGTWEYIKDIEADTSGGTTVFNRSTLSTKLQKSSRMNVGIWYNPKLWRMENTDNPEMEYSFINVKGDAYLFFFTDRIPMPMDSVATLLYEHFLDSDPDAQIINRQKRIVNGNPVIFEKFTVSKKGVKMVYSCYFFSSDSGYVELVAQTYEGFENEYKQDIEDALNGFVTF